MLTKMVQNMHKMLADISMK